MQSDSKAKGNLTVIQKGILQSSDTNGPSTIVFEETKYNRFMDGFYIDGTPRTLTIDQVKAICRERSKNPRLIRQGAGNELVKRVVSNYIVYKNPNTLLEIGSGIEPVLQEKLSGTHYVLSDVDSEVVRENQRSGRECVEFRESGSLPYRDNYFEIIVAVFVFHFKIYPNQINEIRRCLKRTGILMANVYHLDETERQDIVKSFAKKDLQVERINDPMASCKQNEYWLISKDSDILLAGKSDIKKILDKEINLIRV